MGDRGLTAIVDEALRPLARWRWWLAPPATGVLLALSFPFADLHYLIWVSLVPLVVALRHASPWRCAGAGLLAGFVWRIGTLYWIGDVMVEFGNFPGPIGLAITALLAWWMALNMALVCLLVPVSLRWGARGAAVLAAAWVSLEYLQTLMPFGFPWSLLGYAAGRGPLLMQSADLAGVWGLSFLVVFVNVAIALRIVEGPRARVPATVAAVLLVGAAVYGVVRIAEAPSVDDPAGGATVQIAAVQGNVEQGRVWNPDERVAILSEHVRLSLEAIAGGAQLVMWPESSVPVRGGLQGDPSTKQMLAQLARQHDTTLVVGSPYFERDAAGVGTVSNSAFLVQSDGAWVGRYDKVHLVPWGEYVPVSWLFRFVAPLVNGVAGFRRGAGDQALFADAGAGIPPFAMAICYEIVFPDHIRRQVAGGATFIATITNDAWFGETSAPYQHFSMARLRAVETRRFLVRAANTGISGVIDPWGRVLHRSELNTTALTTAAIVPATVRTLYVRGGYLFAPLCVIVAIMGAITAWMQPARFAYSSDKNHS